MSSRSTSRGAGSAPAEAVNLAWLVKLRWVGILGLMLAVPVAERALHVALDHTVMAILIGTAITANVAVHWALVRERSSRALIRGLLLCDMLLLTVALYFSGGTYNPFVLSYLAILVLAATLVGRPEAARFAALAGVCVLFLAAKHVPLHADHEHHPHHQGDEHHHANAADATSHVRVHAEDMWLAFIVLAALITYLGNWSLRQREVELAALKIAKLRSDRLAELGALAATAAHELSSPLTTIAIASKELAHAMERGDALDDRIDDVRLIRAEVERCRTALDAMAQRARGNEDDRVALSDIVTEACARSPEPSRVDLLIDDGANDAVIDAPRGALVEVLRGLLANAFDASPGDARIALRASGNDGRCRIDVIDSGMGIDAADVGRIGDEPFTTKGSMGIGLFAGRAVIEKLGGELELTSREGRGTQVTLHLPMVTP